MFSSNETTFAFQSISTGSIQDDRTVTLNIVTRAVSEGRPHLTRVAYTRDTTRSDMVLEKGSFIHDPVLLILGAFAILLAIGLVLFIIKKHNKRKSSDKDDTLTEIRTPNTDIQLLGKEDPMSSGAPLRDNIDDSRHDQTQEKRSPSMQAFLDKLAKNFEKGDHSKINQNKFLNDQVPLLYFVPSRELKREDFTVGNILGAGNFGTVHQGVAIGLFYPGSRTQVAMKTVHDITNHNDTDCFLAEMKILSNLNFHVNLVNMVGSYTTRIREDGEIWMLLEYCALGDVKNFLTKNRGKFIKSFGGCIDSDEHIESRLLIQWSYDVAKGMEYLARKRIMHGDLAARNILLSSLGNSGRKLVAKVADFGLSKKIATAFYYRKLERNYVPWKWMAYEFLEDNIFKMKSDVWSYGVVVWELLSLGEIPYEDQDFEEVFEQLQDGYRLSCPELVKSIKTWGAEDFYKAIAKRCFVKDEEHRSSFEEVVKFIESQLREDELRSYEEVSSQDTCKSDLLLDVDARVRLATMSSTPRKGSLVVPKKSFLSVDRRTESTHPLITQSSKDTIMETINETTVNPGYED